MYVKTIWCFPCISKICKWNRLDFYEIERITMAETDIFWTKCIHLTMEFQNSRTFFECKNLGSWAYSDHRGKLQGHDRVGLRNLKWLRWYDVWSGEWSLVMWWQYQGGEDPWKVWNWDELPQFTIHIFQCSSQRAAALTLVLWWTESLND